MRLTLLQIYQYLYWTVTETQKECVDQIIIYYYYIELKITKLFLKPNLCLKYILDFSSGTDVLDWFSLGPEGLDLQTWEHSCLSIDMQTGNITVSRKL